MKTFNSFEEASSYAKKLAIERREMVKVRRDQSGWSVCTKDEVDVISEPEKPDEEPMYPALDLQETITILHDLGFEQVPCSFSSFSQERRFVHSDGRSTLCSDNHYPRDCMYIAHCVKMSIQEFMGSTRPFQRSDILGEWTHRDSLFSTNKSYSVSVILLDDGTFDQIIKIDGDFDVRKSSGTWRLDAPRIHLEGLLTYDVERRYSIKNWGLSSHEPIRWDKTSATWLFVVEQDDDQPVALFGGLHKSPDSFVSWTKNR